RINDVLYSPQLGDNLISIPRLDLAGLHSHFGNSRLVITDSLHNDRLMATGTMINLAYILNAEVLMPGGTPALPLPQETINTHFFEDKQLQTTPMPLPIQCDASVSTDDHPVDDVIEPVFSKIKTPNLKPTNTW